MPYGEGRQFADGVRWRGRWRDEHGVLQHTGFIYLSKRQAELAAAREEEKSKAGFGSKDRAMTWGAWCPVWLQNRKVAASTQANTPVIVAKWLTPYWADRKLREITPHEVRLWMTRMTSQGAGPWVIAKTLSLLSSSMAAAADVPYIDSNPCHGIRAPKTPHGPGIAFTEAEVERLLAVLDDPYRTAVLLMAYMGLRFGEMAGMHWGDVDESRRQVWVSHVWSRDGKVVEFTPKSGKERWVPLPARVAEALVRPGNWQEACGLAHQRSDPCPGQLVVPGPRGAPLDSKNMGNRVWTPAKSHAGIAVGRQHDLRHTHITWLIEAGMSAEEVGPLVGHSSSYVTERYTHLLSRHHMKALDILDRLGVAAAAPQSAPRRRLEIVPRAL